MAGTRLKATDIKPDIRDVHTIAWPGTDHQVGLMLLRCHELQQAHFSARAWFKRKGHADVDLVTVDEFELEEMLQQCFFMLVDPEATVSEARIFSSADEARKLLDSDERSFFCGEHGRLQREKWQAFTDTTEGSGDEEAETE